MVAQSLTETLPPPFVLGPAPTMEFMSAALPRSGPRPATATPAWTLRSAVLVVALVAGLFAMHGLGTHGAHAAEAVPETSSSAHAAHHAPAESEPESEGGAGLLGLCLVLLSAGLIWVWTRRGERLWWRTTRRVPDRRDLARPARARGHSPPLRAELSIWRC